MAKIRISDIDGYSFEALQYAFEMYPENEPIELAITSGGGSAFYGFAIYDLIKMSGRTVTATVLGACNSAATVVLLACKERNATEHSEFLLHYPALSWRAIIDERLTADKLKEWADIMESDNGSVLDFYEKHLSISRAEIETMLGNENAIKASEALRIGLITSVINTTAMEKNMFQKAYAVMQRSVAAVMSAVTPVAMETETEYTNTPLVGGGTITTEGEPAVGITANIGDTTAGDGDYETEGGVIIKIQGGVIVEIMPIESPEETPTTEEEMTTELATEFAEMRKAQEQTLALLQSMSEKSAEMESKLAQLTAEKTAKTNASAVLSGSETAMHTPDTGVGNGGGQKTDNRTKLEMHRYTLAQRLKNA